MQTRHKQWYFGKSLDGFTPMGPFIVTEDDVPRPPKLAIKSRVNEVLRQNSSTDMFIFDIPHVIAELSAGMRMIPPRFLHPGDVVECGIEGIGCIRNTIV